MNSPIESPKSGGVLLKITWLSQPGSRSFSPAGKAYSKLKIILPTPGKKRILVMELRKFSSTVHFDNMKIRNEPSKLSDLTKEISRWSVKGTTSLLLFIEQCKQREKVKKILIKQRQKLLTLRFLSLSRQPMVLKLRNAV